MADTMGEIWRSMAQALEQYANKGYKPYDLAITMTVALKHAGYRIVRIPASQREE